jgi:putative protease
LPAFAIDTAMTCAMPLIPPELLAPAGTLKNMRYAFAYGADAVYAGQPRYSLRVRNNEFDHANLAASPRPRLRASVFMWWSISPRTTPS